MPPINHRGYSIRYVETKGQYQVRTPAGSTVGLYDTEKQATSAADQHRVGRA